MGEAVCSLPAASARRPTLGSCEIGCVRTAYCGAPIDSSDRETEDSIPRALGGRLLVDAHGGCNRKLNSEIDEPLIKSVPMQVVLSAWGIKGRYGRAPLPATVTGTDRKGQRSTLRFLPVGRAAVTHRPHEIRDKDGTVEIRFDHSESDEVIRAKVEVVRRRGDQVCAMKQRGSIPGGYRVQFRLPEYGWTRFAAKVALAVGSLAADELWMHSHTAQQLREVLWSPTTECALRLYMAPGGLPAGHAVNGALVPPEHLVWTSHTPTGLASVCIVLFGEWFLLVPLAMTAAEGWLIRDDAWLINPFRASKPGTANSPIWPPFYTAAAVALRNSWPCVLRRCLAPRMRHVGSANRARSPQRPADPRAARLLWGFRHFVAKALTRRARSAAPMRSPAALRCARRE